MDCIIDKIKQRFNIKVIDIQDRPLYYNEVGMCMSDFVNKSYIIGCDTIVLGLYDNKEKRIASLFHEIGHTLVKNDESQYKREKEAWEIGIELAKEYNIDFSKETLLWIDEQVSVYKEKEK